MLVPAPLAFYDGGLVDFSVAVVFLAGAVALPMVGIAFAATREGHILPAALHLAVDRALTLLLLVLTAGFAFRGDAAPVLLFGGATAVFGVLLLTTVYGADEAREDRDPRSPGRQWESWEADRPRG